MEGRTTTATTSKPRRTRLTNTNTDYQCCDTSGSGNALVTFVRKAIYRMNLWTGLYMLNQNERAAFHILGWVVLFSFCSYCYAFWKGFIDGLTQDGGDSVPQVA